ncbi:MAG: TlpA family protein disulfide reductase [Planctomycetes bacterium]|nr:TlpA family protein disulfide reductase [Planctomycetota bacterium]
MNACTRWSWTWSVACGLLVGAVLASPLHGAGETEAEAEALLTRCLDRHRGLQSYRGRSMQSFEMKLEDADADDMLPADDAEHETSLTFARPNRLALVSEQISVHSDGVHLWVAMPFFGRYTKGEAPERLNLRDVVPEMLGPSGGWINPITTMLLARSEDTLRDVFPDMAQLDGVSDEIRDGKAVHRIDMRLKLETYSGTKPSPARVWIDRETSMLRELRVDLTDAYNEMSDSTGGLRGAGVEDGEDDEGEGDEWDAGFEMPRFEKMVVIVRYEHLALDGDLPESTFVYEPEPGEEEVDEFDWMQGGGPEGGPEELIGEPAPEFATKDLDGNAIALADFKGKVVVLDFWATWCAPCVQAMPHMQKLAERFADRPVTVLGVNQDQGDARKLVKKFIEKKKITLRHAMDSAGEIGRSYMVTGIPCTVLIDGEGVVQHVQTGYMPGQEETLAEDIETLLAGEDLYDPEEVRRRREERAAGAQAESDGTGTGGIALEEHAPNRLVEGERIRGQFRAGGWQTLRVDLDGDGRSESVSPGMQGRILIVAGDGSGVEVLRLEGLARGSQITSIEPVGSGVDHRWLVASMSARGRGTAVGLTAVGLYTSHGDRMWSHEFDLLPAGATATVVAASGDLDGQGAEELVVGLNTWSGRGQHAHLAIFDSAGALLCVRKLGMSVELVHVVDAGPSAPGTIICLSNGRFRRFGFDPAADPGAAPVSEPRSMFAEMPALGDEWPTLGQASEMSKDDLPAWLVRVAQERASERASIRGHGPRGSAAGAIRSAHGAQARARQEVTAEPVPAGARPLSTRGRAGTYTPSLRASGPGRRRLRIHP